MLFNSFQFLVFFLIFYSLFLVVRRYWTHKAENRLLLIASYIFYAAWDWRFLSLIFISTVVDYYCGRKISSSKDTKTRKQYLLYSIFTNLAILGFFKYFGFFVDNLKSLLDLFGLAPNIGTLNLILPIGISFYTFQTLSYTIDIYRRKLKPAKDFFDFALFVSFFPQLVAGPIERAKRLLPQITSPRTLNLEQFYRGCFLIFWGLFMKIVIADNLGARVVDPIYGAGSSASGIYVLLAVYAFAFQIFCDFAGYSNIARGLAKLLGFELMVNFKLPYFAANPREFWRRWHISLSTWFRDYLYIPLGGNRKGRIRTIINLFVTMVLCGLWHGAAWTFVVWGVYHATLLIVHRISLPILAAIGAVKNLVFRRFWYLFRLFVFFNLVCLGWLFFRAESLSQAIGMLNNIFTGWVFTGNVNFTISLYYFLLFSSALLVVQIFQYKKNDLLYFFNAKPVIKILFYTISLYFIIIYGFSETKEFIYFQF